MGDKDTVNTIPVLDLPDADTPNAGTQDSGSADSNSPYLLINHKFTPYSTNTMKNQKKRGNKIDDKFINQQPSCPWRTRCWYPQCFLPRCYIHQLLSSIIIEKLLICPLLHQTPWKTEK